MPGDIDHDIGVGILRERLRDHRLAAPKGARHGRRAAQGHREERVDDPLAGQERLFALQLLHHGARLSHRPLPEREGSQGS